MTSALNFISSHYGMIGSITVFLVVYVFIASEKIEKTVAAILGAVAVLVLGLTSFEDAMKAVDLNVIFLLIGMMTCVAVLSETGFFEFVAIYIAKATRGNAILILALLLFFTMVVSAFLDNVTTVILLVPVIILITQILEIPTIPFIILMALASNIGGTATLIGDPPNIIIGSKANLSFNDFLFNLTPGITVIGIVFIGTSLFILRKKLSVPLNVRMRIMDSYPALALRDKPKMWISLAVFALMFLCFFLQRQLGLEAGTIALGGMALMLMTCKLNSEVLLKAIQMDTIMFFIGLFIIIGALNHNGVLSMLADGLVKICGKDMFMACMIVLWGSALFSAIFDNIPFVIAMMPMVQKMLQDENLPVTGVHPIYWALAIGACLGGNGTLIGASANVVSCKLAESNGYRITFANFFYWGFPMMIQQVFIGMLYLWLRYF